MSDASGLRSALIFRWCNVLVYHTEENFVQFNFLNERKASEAPQLLLGQSGVCDSNASRKPGSATLK